MYKLSLRQKPTSQKVRVLHQNETSIYRHGRDGSKQRRLSSVQVIQEGAEVSVMSGQKVQTKRNERNKHKWEKQVGHALRLLNRAKFFKYKSRGE